MEKDEFHCKNISVLFEFMTSWKDQESDSRKKINYLNASRPPKINRNKRSLSIMDQQKLENREFSKTLSVFGIFGLSNSNSRKKTREFFNPEVFFETSCQIGL